jgi:uncharacterized membrane protein (DUF2068 family)
MRSNCCCNRDNRILMDGTAGSNLEHKPIAARHRHAAGLRAVASLELAKGVIVLLLGFGAVSLVHKDVWDVAEGLLRFLRVSPDRHYAQVFLNLADNVTDAKLWLLAAAAAAYSMLRFIEAYGLWLERAWAEWLALISGALYVPFETYELVHRPSLIRAAVLLINLGIVLYMLYLRMVAESETY